MSVVKRHQMSHARATGNAWKYIDIGNVRFCYKSFNGTGGSRAAGATWFLFSGIELPPGCSTVADIDSLSVTIRTASYAGLLGYAVEPSAGSTTLAASAVNNGGVTTDFGTPLVRLTAIVEI